MLADLWHYYRIDLRTLFAPGEPPISPRLVLTLAGHLPDDSALHASRQGGPEFRGWTADRFLLAGIFDAAQAGNWQRSGGKGHRPKPVPRPRMTRTRVVRVADLARRKTRG